MKRTYTLTVFNTCMSQDENIEVTKEVSNEFRRGEWRIEKNDKRHRIETLYSARVCFLTWASNSCKHYSSTVWPKEIALN